MSSFHLIKLSFYTFFWLGSNQLLALTKPCTLHQYYSTFHSNSEIFENVKITSPITHPPKAKVIPNLWLVKLRNKAYVHSFSEQLRTLGSVSHISLNSANIQNEKIETLNVLFEIEIIDSTMGLISVRLKNADLSFWNEQQANLTKKISELDGVDLIQYTHEIVKRVLPNDPLINRQLHLSQISADKIWNYSAQAITKSGDTLVIAVIDDGYDTSHPDLKTNLFTNHKEIPWNGIDDDGNSYIDDYHGWNSGDQNPQIFNEVSVYDGHGTSVAGVIGAGGNNEIGVSGVVWTVKMLPINCWPKNMTDVELGLIRGMVYAYRMKQLYIKSGGKLGANIVALNQSLGMDNGYPEDSPLWCQMFDSLGSVGILTAAATTNRNIKIENFGDLPTMCPSKHLIIVSASNKDNLHYTSGYSTEYVDLAAPGVQVYTTQPTEFNQEDPYVAETGTSFSSPQVAATISLLHSLVCDSFSRLYLSNPTKAHELFLSWLDNSVSKNSNLKLYTRTGGSLDVWQWYDEMRNWCKLVDPTYVGLTIKEKPIFRIFPNPTSRNRIHIYNEGIFFKEELHFKIVDFSGRVIDLWDEKYSSSDNPIMDREINLMPGTYFLQIYGSQSGRMESIIFIVY